MPLSAIAATSPCCCPSTGHSRSTNRPFAAMCAISPTTSVSRAKAASASIRKPAKFSIMTREEKRRVLEIAMEEAHGKLPIIAGTWALTTDETVETAKDCKALGVDGIFVTPPGGAQDVTSCWDADSYPEIWLDQIIAQDRAVDLPIVTHPVGGAKPPFHPGLPLAATLRICREVKNVVGWKMTYMYDGFRIIAKGLRSLDRPVAVMGALASRFHEYKATGMFDGTLSGFWTFAKEPMLDHLDAWDARDIDKACAIWNGGLCDCMNTSPTWAGCISATRPRPGCAV